MDFEIQDQVVIVSGGSRGIGKAMAGGFLAAGCQTVITGRDMVSLQQTVAELGGGTPLTCDVSKPDQILELTRQVIEQFGQIDSLVNVAGVNRRKPALELSEDDYDFIMDINLKGAFLLSQAVGRHMVERGSGCQINVASLNTDRPLTNVLPYAMSKSGMESLTRGLALEWGSSGVRVNGVAPGFILTDLTKKLWADPTLQQWGHANTPLGRLGKPQDLVGTALFLASPAAAFITGHTIYVDGGFSAGRNWPIPEGTK